MKPWLIGRNVPGGCEELCVCCVAGDGLNDAQAAFEAIECGDKEEYCSLVYDRPEESVKDKDGNAFRPILLPQYRLEATVPESCYKEFGSDLDSCSRQESQGCQGCRVLREATTDEA